MVEHAVTHNVAYATKDKVVSQQNRSVIWVCRQRTPG